MSDDIQRSGLSAILWSVVSRLIGSEWVEVLGQLWQFVARLIGEYAHEGLYEVLDCDFNLELRPRLKKAGFLTRDARIKERKKYGQPGARKRFQFSKR